jgi:hypothetical protein
MLEVRIRLYRNPWEHTVPNDELVSIIDRVAKSRAVEVQKHFESGEYKRNSMAIVILDPTAPIWKPSAETLLATISIGPDGNDYVVNAIAKAVEHRDKGQLAGYGAYVDLTQTEDGDFTYGYSTQVDNTIGGASGATELQDSSQAGHALVSFNFYIRQARKAWYDADRAKPKEEHSAWFCDENTPLELYTQMAAHPGVLYDGFSLNS